MSPANAKAGRASPDAGPGGPTVPQFGRQLQANTAR
jgi:hypothetical protein